MSIQKVRFSQADAPPKPAKTTGLSVRTIHRIAIVLFLCLAALPCARGWARDRLRDSGERTESRILSPGEYELRIGDDRKYLLHIPARYNSATPAPLVLFFHGGGGHMEQAASDYGWREKSEREGFIVVFPNGSSPLPRQHLATWNAGECCGSARDQNVDDTAFVRDVITDIGHRTRIDPARVFATGMSNGGMLAHQLGCEMAGTFRAVASVAGTDNTKGCTPSRPVSVLHIHALDDTHVLFGGGVGEDAFRDESKVTDFTSVEETVRRWVVRNHAQETPQRVLNVPGAYGDLYTSRENSAQIELVVTTTGGHSWPGGKAVRGKTPSRAIDATDLIWDFFMRQAK